MKACGRWRSVILRTLLLGVALNSAVAPPRRSGRSAAPRASSAPASRAQTCPLLFRSNVVFFMHTSIMPLATGPAAVAELETQPARGALSTAMPNHVVSSPYSGAVVCDLPIDAGTDLFRKV